MNRQSKAVQSVIISHGRVVSQRIKLNSETGLRYWYIRIIKLISDVELNVLMPASVTIFHDRN